MVQEIRIQQPRIGTRKLYHLLADKLKNLGVGRDRLFAILKANHMLIEPKRRYHVTTDSHHRFRKHRNLIEGMTPFRPEQLWVADITYVGNKDYPLYLALITDAYSKKIVGYNLSDSFKSGWSCKGTKNGYQAQKLSRPIVDTSFR